MPIDRPVQPWTCTRCGHSSDWHSLDSELNVGPLDASARFSCNGPNLDGCAAGCPDMQPAQPAKVDRV